MAENKPSMLGQYIRQPEFKPVFYLLPVFVFIGVVCGASLSFPWSAAVPAVLLIALSIMAAVSWQLARANMHIKLETKQMHSIILHLPIGVIAYDTDFRVMIFNPAAQEIFNLHADRVVDKILTAEMAGDRDFALLIQTVFSTLASTVVRRSEPGQFPQVLDLSFLEPPVDVRTVTDRIVDEHGVTVGFIKMVTDRTRENELLRSKTEFISIAAHQLRTPLTAVNWAFESLRASKTLTEQQDRDVVQTGFAASKRMLKTVNDLLDGSKSEEGRFGFEFEEVDIVSYLEEVLVDANAVAKQYGIRLYFQRPTAPLPHVFVDRQKLGMALYNVLDNAVRYNVENGEIVVTVESQEREAFVKISVKDTGIGIAPAETGKLFTRFFRGENAIKFVADGTGLGLYIVRNIVRSHGGRVWVESELNRGTTFSLTVPTDQSLLPKKEWTGFE